MHAQAPKAAEAARCAGDQGKFWEMHDQLFANQRALQVADLRRAATELGLDSGKFNTCVDSGRYAAAWKADMEAGTRLGVNATPTFFVNGRIITGAGSVQAFADVIDQELARARMAPMVPPGRAGSERDGETIVIADRDRARESRMGTLALTSVARGRSAVGRLPAWQSVSPRRRSGYARAGPFLPPGCVGFRPRGDGHQRRDRLAVGLPALRRAEFAFSLPPPLAETPAETAASKDAAARS